MIDMSVKSEIQVSCKDQLLKITDAPVLSSGGLNEVRVVFSFCEKWKGFAKTALFYREPENVYYAVLDSNDTCVVPWEVYYEEGTFFFGVFGEKDNTRRTSSIVRYKVKNGAITSEMLPSDPTPAVYDQIMALFAEAIEQSKSFRAEAEVVIEATKQATTGALTATENANTAASNANNAAHVATTSANNADVATANAITATNNANTATNRANTAADNANMAAYIANTAAANANTATERANNSAINADVATSNANTATSNANQATQNANTAANTANTQADKATQATANAITATQNANNAASDARTATNETNTARENIQQTASEVLTSLSNAVFAAPIECSAKGNVVAVTDASDYLLRGLTIYGKTTQNGTPTPGNPVELENVGASGAIGVFVGVSLEDTAPQTLIVQTPNGFHGIPVTHSGYNRIDASGQLLVCDYKDYAKGVNVQMAIPLVLDGSESWAWESAIQGFTLYMGNRNAAKRNYVANFAYCSHYPYGAYANADMPDKTFKVHYSSSLGSPYLYIKDSDFVKEDKAQSLAALKAFLAENPITVVYQAETPVETPISAEEMAAFATLHTNKPNTTVYNDGDAYMEMEYIADTEKFVEEAMASADTMVKPVEKVWEQRMLERIDQTMIPMVALHQMAKAPSGYIPAGTVMTGINYSSVASEEQRGLVGVQIPLSTYYSAIENPASKMYTEDKYQDDIRKSTYYGITCSGFVSYVCGLNEFVWTEKMAELFADKVLTVETEDDLFQVRRGDILLNTIVSSGSSNHVMLVKDVVCDRRTGKLLGFNISEGVEPFVRTTFRDLEYTLSLFYKQQPYRLIRLADSDYGLGVTPISYSKSIYPDNGDGGKYTSGESVWLYIPNPVAVSITVSVDGGEKVKYSLKNMNSAYVNGVRVYEFVPTVSGTYTIYANTATNDSCKVEVI